MEEMELYTFKKTDSKNYIIRIMKLFHSIPKHIKLSDLSLTEEISPDSARYFVIYKHQKIQEYKVQ